MAASYALKDLTPEQLKPLWDRREISLARIGKALGVSRQAVAWQGRKFGFDSRAGNYKGQKKGTDEDFIRLWEAGVSLKAMRDYCGYSLTQNVSQRARMLGLKGRFREDGKAYPALTLSQYAEIELKRLLEKDA